MQLLPLLTILLVFASAAPRYVHRRADQPAPQAQTSLELTASISRQRYCRNSFLAGPALADLDLRLSFRNVGQQPLILYKGSTVVYRQMFSASVQEAARHQYLHEGRFSIFPGDPPQIARNTTPDKNFVVLRPGAVFETHVVSGAIVLVKRTDEEAMDPAFGTGEYVMQIVINTFPYSDELATDLRKLWKTSGELWVDDVTSKPMAVKIEKDRRFVNCNR